MKSNKIQNTIARQCVDHTIKRVLYSELNAPHLPVHFDGFDNFDLGIDIEFSNGFEWHIGWKNHDFHQLDIGKSRLKDYHDELVSFDVTDRWLHFTNAPLRDIDVIYVNEEWKIPSRCILTFADSQKITILLGEELNLDGSLPLQLEFVEASEMYVFFGENIPRHRDVRMELPSLTEADTPLDSTLGDLNQKITEQSPKKSVNTNVLIGLLLLFIVTILILIWLSIKNQF